MILQKRNIKPFYYAKLDEEQQVVEILDDEGRGTGEYAPVRMTPTKTFGNISVPTGFANIEKFGNIVSYDLLIVMDNVNTPINESTVLWVYNDPNKDEPWDFMVRRVAKSINSVTLQCAQAKVTYAND